MDYSYSSNSPSRPKYNSGSYRIDNDVAGYGYNRSRDLELPSGSSRPHTSTDFRHQSNEYQHNRGSNRFAAEERPVLSFRKSIADLRKPIESSHYSESTGNRPFTSEYRNNESGRLDSAGRFRDYHRPASAIQSPSRTSYNDSGNNLYPINYSPARGGTFSSPRHQSSQSSFYDRYESKFAEPGIPSRTDYKSTQSFIDSKRYEPSYQCRTEYSSERSKTRRLDQNYHVRSPISNGNQKRLVATALERPILPLPGEIREHSKHLSFLENQPQNPSNTKETPNNNAGDKEKGQVDELDETISKLVLSGKFQLLKDITLEIDSLLQSTHAPISTIQQKVRIQLKCIESLETMGRK